MSYQPLAPLAQAPGEPAALYLQRLEAAVAEERERHGRGSSQGAAAFQRYMRESYRLGRPADGLRQPAADEEERFFALTAQGPDGHVYWLGAQRFERNDGAYRLPARWWWEHRHGVELEQNAIVRPACGEPGCINPEHCARWTRPQHERRYSEQAMLGALQAAALRAGHAPSKETWAGPPSTTLYLIRFGSWSAALAAAGLEPRARAQATAAQCLAALRAARRALGFWPSWGDMERPRVREALERAGLPRRPNTIIKRLGCSWAEALRRAGKRGRP